MRCTCVHADLDLSRLPVVLLYLEVTDQRTSTAKHSMNFNSLCMCGS